MSKVLFVANYDMGIYNFRREIIEKLIEEKHEVYVSTPVGTCTQKIKDLGVYFCEATVERHGKNPLQELKLLAYYYNLMKEVKPDIVFGYTIKPNIYGAIAARKLGIPFIANITGLGTAVETESLIQKVLICLYKFAFKKVKKVFFQNKENMNFFRKYNIGDGRYDLLPGSGVNLERFPYKEYPENDIIKFAFISRIMKEKGIEQYLYVAEKMKTKYENVEFHVCGFYEEEYDGKLHEMIEKNIVKYHGTIHNVAEFLEDMNAVIHPTYYPEGLSNVLLESCASGRPIITTDRSGCREVIEDGFNGYMVPQQSYEELLIAVNKFISLPMDMKKQMGLNARSKVEKEFNRNIVVQKYIEEVNRI